MQLRCAQITDADKINRFYQYVINNNSNNKQYARWVYGLHPTNEMIIEYINNNELYIFEKNEIILGCVAITMYQNDDYHSIDWHIECENNEVAVIHILCVNPDYLHQGLGKRIVQDCINLAKLNNKKAVRLDALECNIPAHSMYQSLGFKYRGTQHLYADNTGWTNFLYFEYSINK